MHKYLLIGSILLSSLSMSSFAEEKCNHNYRWDEERQECVPAPVGSIRG